MPLYEQGQDPRDAGAALSPERAPIGQPTAPQIDPSLSDIPGAAMRVANPVYAAVSLMDSYTSQSADYKFDPNHNPLDTIKGTWAEQHPDMFMSSPNEATTRAMIAKGEKENQDRATLAAAGVPGMVAAFGAGLLDPTLLIMPAAVGGGALRSAARLAAVGAGQAAVSEGALYADQVTKTKQEALNSVATQTLMMGVLGGALGHLSPVERGLMDRSANELRPYFKSTPESLSAAQADARTMEQLGYGIDRVFKGESPNSRIYGGESVAAKRTAADLADTARRFTQAEQGVPTAMGGAPVETLVRMDKSKFMQSTHDVLQSAWKDHYYGDVAPSIAERATYPFQELLGRTSADKLSYGDFKEAVFDALYSGDKHAVPEVQTAAQRIRKNVLDPLADMAKKTLTQDGTPLLDPDTIKPKGDDSFVSRVWNSPAIIAKRNDFRDTITNWLHGEQVEKAATKDKLAKLNDRHNELSDKIDKLDGRLETIGGKLEETSTRMSETAQQARKAVPREEALQQRAGDIKQGISEVQEFISTMRGELTDPDQLARLKDLEQQVSMMRKEAAPMSAAELVRLEKEEVGSILTGDLRKAAEIVVGKRASPKEPSFTHWMAKEGGVFDEHGDLESVLGGKNVVPGLIRKERNMGFGQGRITRSLDDWGERFYEEAPEHFPNGRPTPAEVLDIIDEAHRGRAPQWFLDNYGGGEARQINALVDHLHETFDDIGAKPTSLREVAEALNGIGGQEPKVLGRLREKAAAAGELPAAEADLAGRYQGQRDLRAFIERGLEARGKMEVGASREGARASEASIAAGRVKGRIGILQERLDRQALMQDMLQNARNFVEEMRSGVRKDIEETVSGWKGKSSAEAIRSLKERNQAEIARQAQAVMGRRAEPKEPLKSADRPVDRAVRSILASERDLSREELGSRADEIIDRILGTPDGRMPYDIGSGGPRVGWSGGDKANLRGSLNERDFAIPTKLVRDYVVRDVEHVLGSHVRTILPDIHLTQRFGDVDMTTKIKEVLDDYARKIAGLRESPKGNDAAWVEKESTRLHEAARADIRDLAAMRDRIRNVYGWDPKANRTLNNIIRDFHNWTSLTSLGSVVVNSVNDFGAQAAMRYGITHVLGDIWAPMFQHMVSLGKSELTREMKRQAGDMGVGVEALLGHLRHNLTDINESYMPGSKFSRGVAWAADAGMKINLQEPWTDWMKAINWNAAQQEFARAAEKIAAGNGTKRDIARMADANIDPQLASRIWKQYAEHATGFDSFAGRQRLPNAHLWTDAEARRAFEAAMNREANILVITPGVGDKPLWLSTPLGGLIGQFKGFVSASHERMLVSNLQQRDMRTLSGAIFSVALGMLSYRLYTLASGQQASERPQDWIKEGIDRSSLTGWLSEANKALSKVTAGQVDVNRLYGANRPLTRRQDNSGISEFLGPTYSTVESLSNVATHVSSGGASGRDVHALRKAVPMQNLMGMRILFDQLEDGASNAFGLRPRNRAPHWPQ